MSAKGMPIIILVAAALLLALASLFQVRETEVAIRTQFGEISGAQYGPGLHVRVPFVDEVVKFERRIVTQNYLGETVLTAENKGLTVDFYVKWRILDVAPYYRTTGGNEDLAGSRLGEIVKDGIKSVVAKRTQNCGAVMRQQAGKVKHAAARCKQVRPPRDPRTNRLLAVKHCVHARNMPTLGWPR